jgi:hypothetical protein
MQAILSIILICSLTLLTAATFRQQLPDDFGPMAAQVY